MTPEQEILADALEAAQARLSSFRTKLRNSFAHDYMLSFAQTVPLLNKAWQYAPDLIDVAARAERHVADHQLLRPKDDA